jgi:hypothetical protein
MFHYARRLALRTSQWFIVALWVCLWLGLALLSGCGDSEQDVFDRGYDEGYNAGQYDVCRELDNISPLASRMKDEIRNCRGY